MATSDEVQAKKQHIKELRRKIAVEQGKTNTAVSEADNDIKLARLEAEEKRLNQVLESAQQQSQKKNIKEAVKEQIASGKPESPNLDRQAPASEKE